MALFDRLTEINSRPKPFEFYTARELWTDEHTSKMMLSFHLNEEIDVSSRNAKFIDRSVNWIASRFKISAGTKIADFGCGPGFYTQRLAKKGAAVTGIDFSPRSIQYAKEAAKKNALTVQYVNRNYLELEISERFRLILMIMCDFCALSPAQRKQLLANFFDLLEPNGRILLDVYSLNAFRARKESATYEKNLLNGFWSAEPYFGFLNTFKYESETVMLDKYTVIDAVRTRTVYNWLQYFSPESLAKELNENGFIVEELLSDVAGTPFDEGSNELAVIIKKG